MRRYSTVALGSLVALLGSGCGCGAGDDAGGLSGPDAGHVGDAAPARDCAVQAEYAGLSPATGTATVGPAFDDEPDGPRLLRFELALDGSDPPDLLHLELWEGEGPFADGFTPGELAIVGNYTDLIACDACVFITADYVQGQPSTYFAASSGTIALDAIDATPGTGRLQGALASVNLRHVVLVGAGQEDDNDGCVTRLDSLGFDLAVAAPPSPRPGHARPWGP